MPSPRSVSVRPASSQSGIPVPLSTQRTENSRMRNPSIMTASVSIRSGKSLGVPIPPGTVAAAASRYSTPHNTPPVNSPPAHHGVFHLSPLRADDWNPPPSVGGTDPPPSRPMFATSPLPSATPRPSLPEIFEIPSLLSELRGRAAKRSTPFGQNPGDTISAAVHTSEYDVQLDVREQNGSVRTALTRSNLMPQALATPLHRARGDEPTVGVQVENAQSLISQPSGPASPPADVRLQHYLGSRLPRVKQGRGPISRLTHQRTVSTLSISSMTSLHGTNLPGWQEFDTLPRGQGELTSFPKFQSNCTRSSSFKRIGAKISEETSHGVSGISRFFSKVWMRRHAEPLKHHLSTESNWGEDHDDHGSDVEHASIMEGTISESATINSQDTGQLKSISRAPSVLAPCADKLCSRCIALLDGHRGAANGEMDGLQREVVVGSGISGGGATVTGGAEI